MHVWIFEQGQHNNPRTLTWYVYLIVLYVYLSCIVLVFFAVYAKWGIFFYCLFYLFQFRSS